MSAPQAYAKTPLSNLRFAKRTLGKYLVVAALLTGGFAYSEVFQDLSAEQEARERSNLLERIDEEDAYMAKLQAEKEARRNESLAHHHPPR